MVFPKFTIVSDSLDQILIILLIVWLIYLLILKLSYLNLVEFNQEELSRNYQQTIKKLTNKKPIKL